MKTIPRHTDLKTGGGECLDLDKPRAATEWEDVLIQHGIRKAPPRVASEDQTQLKELERRQAQDPLLKKSLQQLNALEDEVEEDTLASYRAKRKQELLDKAKREKFGVVVQIHESDYKSQVTEASAEPGVWVVCHLFSPGMEECSILSECIEVLAKKFKAVKFVRIKATEAIHNYPESKCPTVLLYNKGDLVLQLVGPGLFGGLKTSPKAVEWGLAKLTVLESDLEENPLSAAASKTVTVRKNNGGESASSDDDL